MCADIQPHIIDTAYTAANAAFLAAYPAFKTTEHLCELRRREYARLDLQSQIYLDYTGGGLHAESQLREHMQLLNERVLGNPHSQNPTSAAATELVEQTRAAVLAYFNADPDEYTVIFTPNATGALKLLGEAYPFGAGCRYVLTFDNHNSVNGIREYARQQGADVTYVPVHRPDLRADEAELFNELAQADANAHNLFAYPAQSNFSGVQHPLAWIERAQELGWDVLLDAAAFAPTNQLDLQRFKPDYVTLSYYKIFGYPTGIGSLLVRKSALAKLRRPWFAGGTITLASVQGEGWHHMAEGAEAFEDGTVNYLNLPAVMTGLRHVEEAGIDAIGVRVKALTGWLLQEMQALRHENGTPLVKLYGPTDTVARGGTIAFNLYRADGHVTSFREVEGRANAARISLRTGCFCNPGAGEIAHGIQAEAIATCFVDENITTYSEFFQHMQEEEDTYASTVRVSVGIASNFADVFQFKQFLKTFLA